MALEGNEVEQKIGSGGLAIVDVSANGIARAEANWSEGGVKAGAFVEIDVILILEKLVVKSDNKMDDALLGMVKSALGR
jgi:hypothetical protein